MQEWVTTARIAVGAITTDEAAVPAGWFDITNLVAVYSHTGARTVSDTLTTVP